MNLSHLLDLDSSVPGDILSSSGGGLRVFDAADDIRAAAADLFEQNSSAGGLLGSGLEDSSSLDVKTAVGDSQGDLFCGTVEQLNSTLSAVRPTNKTKSSFQDRCKR